MRTIILIDNNKDDLQFLKEAVAFVDADTQCLSFVYGDEAMLALKSGLLEKPYLIFMSLNMPGKNGIECLRMLRNSERFDDVPVILYAPRITSDVVESLTDLGIAMTFQKPNTIRGWKTVVLEMLTSVHIPDLDMETLIAESKNQLFYS
jgi:CheY-like chemotaxis protein